MGDCPCATHQGRHAGKAGRVPGLGYWRARIDLRQRLPRDVSLFQHGGPSARTHLKALCRPQ